MKNLLLLVIICPLVIFSQENNCSQLKDVTLYCYPRNSTDQYKVVRSGSTQVEYNVKTGDSTVYKIKWDKDCQYTLTFISCSEKKSPAELETLKKYKLAYDILSVTASYYVYNIYLDKIVNSRTDCWQMSTDTAWLKPIALPSNRPLFAALKEKTSYLKKHFNDTSSYAIIYLYRPDKIWGLMASYYIYCDQDFIYPAMNKSKIAYKIYKEGSTKIFAKLNKVESFVPLDIKFGKKYYIECLLDNSPPKTTAVLKLRDESKGQVDLSNWIYYFVHRLQYNKKASFQLLI